MTKTYFFDILQAFEFSQHSIVLEFLLHDTLKNDTTQMKYIHTFHILTRQS